MTLEEIKQAVLKGKTVHWSNEGYVVVRDDFDRLLIECIKNKCCVGLTWSDGKTLNGKEEDFYVAVSDADRTELMREALLTLAAEIESIAESLGPDRIDPWGDAESTRLKQIAETMYKAARL